MKISEVPDEAFNAQPTPVPTKVVYDWGSMHEVLITQGFVIIESDEIRVLPSGAEESVLVKMFNSHLRQIKGLRLQTKRISATRWYCTL